MMSVSSLRTIGKEIFRQFVDIPGISMVDIVCKLANETLPQYYKEKADQSYDASEAVDLIDKPTKGVSSEDSNAAIMIAKEVIRKDTENFVRGAFTLLVTSVCLKVLAPVSLAVNGTLGTSKIVYGFVSSLSAKGEGNPEMYRQAQNIFECGAYQIIVSLGDVLAGYYWLCSVVIGFYCAIWTLKKLQIMPKSFLERLLNLLRLGRILPMHQRKAELRNGLIKLQEQFIPSSANNRYIRTRFGFQF